MRTLLTGILLLMLPAVACAQDWQKDCAHITENPQWYACKTDADCALSGGVCGPIGVNAHYLNDTDRKKAVSCTAAVASCMPPAVVPHYQAVCEKNECRAVEKK